MRRYNEIKNSFERLQNADNAKRMSAYMRDRFQFYGIPTPERRTVYKQLLRDEHKTQSIDWNLLEICWQDNHREFQYFVLDYLHAMIKNLHYDDIPEIERYIRSKQWWDTIDGLDRIIGEIGLSDSRVDNIMLEWSTDDDFWVRRIAIDHQLCRKEKTNTTLLEKILINNFGSDEFFINKAIGWSLREYSKTNTEWVRNFIEKHRDEMSPLSIREASKYI